MSDNVVALREMTASTDPMKQQILDFVASMIDECNGIKGITFVLVDEDGYHSYWSFPDEKQTLEVVTFAGHVLIDCALHRSRVT